ncbi:MAG: hypothetical protein KY449_05115, partial [Proteobacteria bacterium]|nr:hypothetical protein [Pseudomonadota bacterium]
MLEHERLAALKSYRILDSLPDPAFDEITTLAAELFGAPLAAITLIDAGRQWTKSRLGMEGPCSMPRNEAF